MKKFLALLLIATLPGSPCWAVPQLLNFQGKVRAPEGDGHDGDRDDHRSLDITFRIFNTEAGGAALFSEAHTGQNAVAVQHGVFNVLIGALTSGGIPSTVFDGADKYIELQVGQEILPRQRVASVGYAFHSINADLAANLAGPIAALSVTTVQSTTISASSIAVSGELAIGDHTIHLTNAGGGLGNAITFTPGPGANGPQIRTAATGQQANAAPTGNLPLVINAGASGILNLNTLSSGDTLLAGAGGFVGIGMGVPTTMLDVNGGTVVRSSSTWVGTTAPPLSLAGRGAMYFDSTANQFLVSQNGGIYQPLLGTTGSTGPTGTTGPQGAQGVTGAAGLQGATGATGVQGVTGPQGTQGLQGVTGAAGLAGSAGSTGVQGATGAQGIQGVTGQVGSVGPQGATGSTGVANLLSPTPNFVAKITNTNPNQLGNSSIFDNGNVGIGTTSPAAALHVNGNVIAATPTASNHLATKGYVDAQISSNSGALTNFVPYSTPGNYSFTVPAGVSKVLFELWGGGGSGANGNFICTAGGNAMGGGGGGGAGGYGKGQFQVSPGSVLTITVGAGGVPPTPGAGTYSSPGNASQVVVGGTILISANGGAGGTAWFATGQSSLNGVGGAGGTASAPLSLTGLPGTAASSTGTGGNGGIAYQSFGSGPGGTPWAPSSGPASNGAPGAVPAGGGGGGGGTASLTLACGAQAGSGANGLVILWY